jgi:glycosyltransferase involved in cell wall biosynthesis
MEREPEPFRLSAPETPGVEHQLGVISRRVCPRDEDRVRLPLDRRPQPGVSLAQPVAKLRGKPRPRGDSAEGSVPAPSFESSERRSRQLLKEDDRRLVLDGQLHHPFEVPHRTRRIRVPMEDVPGPDEQAASVLSVRVVLADPPAYTPFYDHDLASALAARGVDVEVLTSRFRFGELPPATGYTRRESFYPLSARLFRRSRLRIPVKALEHPLVLARLATARADVLHVQWLSAPQVDARLLRLRAPSVFTSHDLLPRRTADKRALWRRALSRFDAVVVHSENGRRTLTSELGVPEERIRVIPLAITTTHIERRDDGRTLLVFGVLRPYKGLPDALEVTRRIGDSRLIVAGDPAMPLDRSTHERVEWRLGYLPEEEVRRALSEATVALFPYRPELDQSAALATVLGAGIPAVVYDVNGVAEPVRRFGAGRVVAAGDVDALEAAARELLGDPEALEAARAGAERARGELTWDAAARSHLDVYRELA